MKVLAISSYGRLGGAELSETTFLANRPADVEALALLIEDGPLRPHLVRRGIPTWAASGYDGRPSLSQLARFTRSLVRLLGETKPDVVLAVGLKAAFMAAPACRIARVPVVWRKVDFSLDAVLTRPLGMAVNGVVSVSSAAAAALGPLRSRKLLAVVGVPVRLPADLHLAPSQSPLAIGTLGTLTPIKGQRHIIEAASLLSDEFPDLRILLAGEPIPDYPDYADELRHVAAEKGVADRLELLGFVEDVIPVLDRLTVFVSATFRDERGFGWEGLGGATLEASWAGLPVVVTNGGGAPETLQDGVTGTLVPPADPAALARAIAPYLRDPELARRTGEAGRLFVRERFAPDLVAPRLFQALGGAVKR